MSIDQSVLDKFEAVVESQRKRIMDMKAQDDFIDYSKPVSYTHLTLPTIA